MHAPRTVVGFHLWFALVFTTFSTSRTAVGQDRAEPWYAMDYGPCLATTIAGFRGDNVALKGRAIDLGDGAWVVFDTELLRVAAAWTDGHLELRGTPFDGAHGPIPRARGERACATRQAPGWAHDGAWDDPRPIPHGPLPRDWGRFEGHYVHGDRVILKYRVGDRPIWETFDAAHDAEREVVGIVRTLEVGPGAAARTVVVDVDGPSGSASLTPRGGAHNIPVGTLQVAWQEVVPGRDGQPDTKRPRALSIALYDCPDGTELSRTDGRVVLAIPASGRVERLRLVFRGDDADAFPELPPVATPGDLTRGGPRRYLHTMTTRGKLGSGDGPFAVDTITVPKENPWKSRLRFGAFDFVDADTAALSTWNGDVWLVSGVDSDLDELTWSRFATGLHDPLGLKVVDGVIHAHCRDGIHRLHDVNGDGEADWYEVFNNDVLITKGFHEFAYDLQTDAAGNFYFSKGGPVNPGGRGFQKIVPHHGTVLRVSPDGSTLDVVATGLRAPNGIGVTPDGVVTTGDNQGTWMPACRLNLSTNGTFFGCVDTAQREPRPTTYDEPICWLPMSVDNSGGGQVWIPEDAWGPLGGELLHQSYGQSSIYLVLQQEHHGRTQGGVVRIPADFASSQMRGRFCGGDLYVCGFKGWQTNAARDTAFQRVRRTDAPLRMPVAMGVFRSGIEITFSDALDRDSATDPESFEVEMWNYDWSVRYGSPEYSVREPDRKVEEGQPNRDPLDVGSVSLSDDRRTVFLSIDGLVPAMQMRIAYDVDAADGELITGEIHNTVHFLAKRAPDRDGER